MKSVNSAMMTDFFPRLTLFFQNYLTPLLAATTSRDFPTSPVLSQKTIKEVFANFADIQALAKEILRRLEKGVLTSPKAISITMHGNRQTFRPSGTPETIKSLYPGGISQIVIPRQVGQLLGPILPFLKCYALFVRNFGNAQVKLDKEEKTNEAWRNFVKIMGVKGNGSRLNLSAMLLCIVQRIPRYRLLLGVSSESDPRYNIG